MKIHSAFWMIMTAVVLVSGCATTPTVSTFTTPNRYLEEELTLSLAQELSSGDLLLTLHNISPNDITDRFPEGNFEGSFWVVQQGAPPIQVYPKEYFRMMMTGFWAVPPITLSPGQSLTYRVPLETLLSPFTSRKPIAGLPVLIYAGLNNFELASDAIVLKGIDKIEWHRLGRSEIPPAGAINK